MDGTTEITQSEQHRENRLGVGGNEQSLRNLGVRTRDQTFLPAGSQRRRERGGAEKVFKEIWMKRSQKKH